MKIRKNWRVRKNKDDYEEVPPFIDKDGFACVEMVNKNGDHLVERVHILVAKSFIPNPNNFTKVRHIDGDKRNNKATNLEWYD